MELFYGIILSAHIGLSGSYNPLHPQVGVYLNNSHTVGVGAYYNSESTLSTYIGGAYSFTEHQSIEAGLVTGYASAPIIPMVKYRYKNLFAAPSIDGDDNLGLVLGLEWRTK